MAAAASPDTDALEALDHDWDVPCEVFQRQSKCERPAELIVWRACCFGSLILMCRKCYDDIVAADEDSWECIKCGMIFVPARHFILRSEPLNKRKG